MADLETVAGDVVELECRVEAAEQERDDALERLALSTPRPDSSWSKLLSKVGEPGERRCRAPGPGAAAWLVPRRCALRR